MPGTPELALRFGKRVRALRIARGLSRDKLATSLAISKNAVGRLERGERFNAANLAPLAATLGVEVRDLFDFSDGANPRIESIVSLLRSAKPAELEMAERLLRALFRK